MTAIVLIAKEPVPGRVKTRLHPPLSLQQAALIAAAAIDDTLSALAAVPASRRVLLFDGVTPPAAAARYELVPQTAGPLDERLAAIFDALDEPMVLVGMDTPQLTAHDLAPAFEPDFGEMDAWFGPATDGGFWALGMRSPRGELIRGVAMSQEDTGAQQRARLEADGLRVGTLPILTDVDTIGSAREVAAAAPLSRFGRLLGSLDDAAPHG